MECSATHQREEETPENRNPRIVGHSGLYRLESGMRKRTANCHTKQDAAELAAQSDPRRSSLDNGSVIGHGRPAGRRQDVGRRRVGNRSRSVAGGVRPARIVWV
jgi:hypothetical protein